LEYDLLRASPGLGRRALDEAPTTLDGTTAEGADRPCGRDLCTGPAAGLRR